MLLLKTLGAADLIRPDRSTVHAVVQQPKRFALLTYLAIARPRGFHSRDVLLPLLWPERSEASARHSLSQAVYKLRDALGDNIVITRSDGALGVRSGALSCDVVEFRELLSAARHAEALELYSGDFLPGFYVQHSTDFERWVAAERAALRQSAADAAWALADERLSRGDAGDGERVARRALELDPANSTRLARYLDRLATHGNASLAVHLFEFARAVAAREFNLPPAHDAQRVMARIRAEGVAQPGDVSPLRPEPLTPRAEARNDRGRAYFRHAPFAAAAGVFLVACAIAVFAMNGSARISVANLRDMAVLPCRHPGLAADELYVADQWSAELIDKIAQTGVIRPRPWQAVSRYRNVRVGDSSIASELGAGSVLHCEFSDDPGTLRLVFALFRAADGRRIWTRAYDQPAGPVGASELQALVVSDLAGSLGLAIAPELQRRLARPPTRDSTAWRLYRLARHLLQEVDDQRALTVSARYFRQALELDTSFARAYVGLAEAELWRGHQTSRPSRETYPRVATLVLEGLQRDPLIAEAHSLLARYFFEFTYDWPSAEAEHRRALALNPNSADARHTYGLHLTLRERYREAVAELDRAHQLDPANSLVRGNLARALWFAGEERRAQRELRDGMEIDPRWAPYYHHLALILLNRHQPDSAVALLDRSGDRQLWNAWLYAVAGRPAAARAYLDSLLASDDDADPAAIAWMHIALGQEREALEWLERAYAERSAFVLWLAGPHPAFNPLRRHPRFRELRRRVGLPA